MPQLMPIYWMVSCFMVFLLVMMMFNVYGMVFTCVNVSVIKDNNYMFKFLW